MATIVGTDSQDNLVGTEGADDIFGRKGSDYLFGLGGDDTFYYDTGHGFTQVGATEIGDSDGSDIIDGGGGADRLIVLSDYHYALFGRNSDVYMMVFTLKAESDGFAHFKVSQAWDRYDPFTTGTAVSDVTLKSVEQFTFIGTAAPAPPDGYPVKYSTTDFITVGDLSGTSLAGATLVFSLGSSGDYRGQPVGNVANSYSTLDAAMATNPIVGVGGEGNDLLIGGSANDELIGDGGEDELRGNGGTNTLVGGRGNDVYYSDNRDDTIVEYADQGIDSIRTLAPYYILRPNVETLAYAGTGDFVGIGTAGDDGITGGPGSDYLVGLDGNDYLDGGGGIDQLQGGLGNDVFHVEDSGTTIVEYAGEGIDRVETALQFYTLRDNLENLTFLADGPHRGDGNAADNVLTGGGGNDILYGHEGNDTLIGNGGHNRLIGGTGDDRYVLSQSGDEVIELGGEGVDTVSVAGFAFVLPDAVENLVNTGGSATLTGNALDNRIEGGAGSDSIDGREGDDTLLGGAGNDLLSGGLDNDTLTGGAGGDELTGGAGVDRFVFDAASPTSQDLIHDFSSAEGDKIDVSQLMAGVGYQGSDPFADGYLRSEAIAAFGSGGGPAEKLLFDPDGSAGPQGAISLAIFLGGTAVYGPGDFIYGP